MTYFAIGMIYAASMWVIWAIFVAACVSRGHESADFTSLQRFNHLILALWDGEGAGDAAASITGAGCAAAIYG